MKTSGEREYESAYEVLREVLEEPDISKLVVLTVKSDGTFGLGTFDTNSADLAFAALLLQHEALKLGSFRS